MGVHLHHVVLGYLSHQWPSCGVHFAHGSGIGGKVSEDAPPTLVFRNKVARVEHDHTVQGNSHIHGNGTIGDMPKLDDIPGKVPRLDEGIN